MSLPALILCLRHPAASVRSGALACIGLLGSARAAISAVNSASSSAAPTPSKKKSGSKGSKSSQAVVAPSDSQAGQSVYCLNDASGVDAAVLSLSDEVVSQLTSTLTAHAAELARDPGSIVSVLALAAGDATTVSAPSALIAHVVALGAARPYACSVLFELCQAVRHSLG
jgi:hypothetical protein